MDGGFGCEHIPHEIQTSADLHKIAEALLASGFSQSDTQNIIGTNWLRFFAANLPKNQPIN